MTALSNQERLTFALGLCFVLLVQACIVSSSFYLGTDDWMMLDLGRDTGGVGSLFERQTTGTPAIRPVSILLARVEYALFDHAASPRLMGHVFLHGIAAILVLMLLLGNGLERHESILAALLFAAFPVHAEALAWYHSGHTTIPVAIFCLLTLVGHTNKWPIWTTLLCLLTGLLTRESAIVVAPLALWISWRRQPKLSAAIRDAAPLIAVVILFVAIRSWQVVGALTDDSNAFLTVSSNPLLSVGYVLFHLFIPVHPAIGGAMVWLTIMVLAGLSAAFTGRRLVFATLLWIVICVAPYIPMYPTGDPLFEPVAASYERRWYYLYLPSLGVAWLFARSVVRHKALAVVSLLLLLGLQSVNAHWWSSLGAGAHASFEQLSVLLKKGKPLVFEFNENPIALTEIVEHQVVDTLRLFPGIAPVPVYRNKPGEKGLLRASRDPFNYPIWMNMDRPDRIPTDAIWVSWVESEGRFVEGKR
ncbi:MAG TPA: hypothetical protein EYN06_00150 [Myxococcales bacterium]|nr:hypothetical protein [Myxococcales bacterium]HIN84859.1 hypothetical protein [Myxococcales bacterium]